MFFSKSKIKIDEYPGITFYPFHQLKKENKGNEPYIKSINCGLYSFDFFKVRGEVFAIKPSSKNNMTKALCAKVSNPITIESAQGSISGNCARGIKEQFIRFCQGLSREGLEEKEFFMRLVKSI